jgi:hypothetical protein
MGEAPDLRSSRSGPRDAAVWVTPHPAKAKAQRAALDAIGCGDVTPRMADSTRDALLRAELIVEAGRRLVCNDRFGKVYVPEYAMPVPVHMQWCAYWAEQATEEDVL